MITSMIPVQKKKGKKVEKRWIVSGYTLKGAVCQ